MIYKIFFDSRLLLLTNEVNEEIKTTKLFYEYKDKKKLFDFIKEFNEKKEIPEAYIYSSNFKKLLKQFLVNFHIVKAAGGVVKNGAGKFLVIKRHGKWDLPKGKTKKNERQKHAAVREVAEECGIAKKEIQLLKKLYSTYHTYGCKDKLNLKKTDWYEMKYSGTKEPSPQLEESITETVWFDQLQIPQFYENTFPSLIDVLGTIKFEAAKDVK
jgi:8-oxo-dGTP pyrophosphatase MutT (NUDIX family)